MLTDLSFLEPGQTFPPESERVRLEMYEQNKQLFECGHADVYAEQLKRIERVIGNFSDVIDYTVILNYHRVMSLKIADMLVGEPPRIRAGDAGSREQQAIDIVARRSDLVNTEYMCAIDVSRYGDGLLTVRRDGAYGVIGIGQPGLWFPVVDPNDIKRMQCHVLAWPVETMEMGQKVKRLYAQVHYKGYYEQRVYRMSNDAIERLESNQRVMTGLADFAVIQVPNVITSDRVTGIDDYRDIDSIVSELMVRIGQIAKILDKHASPSMQGPASALERDPQTGEWRLKTGSYYVVDNEVGEAGDVKYITWDGHLDANFKAIEKLTNLLYTISEMGSVVFGDQLGADRNAPSGTALRRLMISPLAKVNRIRMRFDQALKKAIALATALGGPDVVPVLDDAITITWQDGLPGDPMEDAQIMQIRTANKPTMSQKRALMQFDAMTEADADEELETIGAEDKAASPMIMPEFLGNATDEADDGEDDA